MIRATSGFLAFLEQSQSPGATILAGAAAAKSTNSFFKSPDQLATQVVADLHNLLAAEKTGEPSAEPSSKYQINIASAQGVVIGDGA
jgi:hypothetical protein